MSNINRSDSNAAELDEVRVGGKAYRSAPLIGKAGEAHQTGSPLCRGCAGDGSSDLCDALPNCSWPQVIWVSAE